MAAKQWYTIEIECIRFNACHTMKVGEKTAIAKVKSLGLANIVCAEIRNVYNPEYFTIHCK